METRGVQGGVYIIWHQSSKGSQSVTVCREGVWESVRVGSVEDGVSAISRGRSRNQPTNRADTPTRSGDDPQADRHRGTKVRQQRTSRAETSHVKHRGPEGKQLT